MNNAVGRLAYALDASREEQGLCPHEKNPAFDAGMFIHAKNRGALYYISIDFPIIGAIIIVKYYQL